MKHEVILEGQDWLPRDPRVDVGFDVSVHCEAGELGARSSTCRATAFVYRQPTRCKWVGK